MKQPSSPTPEASQPSSIQEAALQAALRDPAQRRAAFSKVMELYQERLYWQIRRMVINHDDTRDLLQNTLMKAWQNLDNFRGDSKLSTWLYIIAQNEALGFLKRMAQEREQLVDDAEGYLMEQAEADANFDGDAVQRRLLQAIASLPDKQRQVFTLRYYDEMPYDEMSQMLGTSVGALKASYHFAAEKVEAYMKRGEVE
jgi:RNA polymerase sigma-70 factor (ECF subfamily)